MAVQTDEEAHLAADRKQVEELIRTWSEKFNVLKQGTRALNFASAGRFGDPDAFHRSVLLPSNAR